MDKDTRMVASLERQEVLLERILVILESQNKRMDDLVKLSEKMSKDNLESLKALAESSQRSLEVLAEGSNKSFNEVAEVNIRSYSTLVKTVEEHGRVIKELVTELMLAKANSYFDKDKAHHLE